jgi:hypothetical protein
MVKKLLKLFLVLLLAMAVFGVYLFLTQNKGASDGEDNRFSFFPFGQISNDSNQGSPDNEIPEVPDTDNQPETPVREPRLVALSNLAVAGSALIKKDRNIPNDQRVSFDFVDFSEFPLMKEGFEGEEVTKLENILLLLNTGNIGASIKTVFDIDTSGILAYFQEERGLTPDGLAGAGTFNILNTEQEKLLDSQTESALAVRYIQKKDGSVIDIFTDSKETSIMSNTIIPRIHEAFFNIDASKLILRYLKSDNETIETFGGVISDGSISGLFFPKDIPFVTVSPDKTKIFYLTQTGEYTNGTISNFENENKTPIFEHAFSEWIPQWGTDSIVSLTTKASYQTPGVTFSLGTGGGEITKEFPNENGITTLISPNGSKILYSIPESGSHKLFIFNRQDNSHTDLGVRTLSEKCSWESNSITLWCGVPEGSLQANLPDAWYQGTTLFTDSLWLLDTDINAHQLVINPREESGLLLDITQIQKSETSEYLTFIDRKTGILYGLDI